MSNSPVLKRIVRKLIDVHGRVALSQCKGSLSAPVESWTDQNAYQFLRDLRRSLDDAFLGLAATGCSSDTLVFIIQLGTRCSTLRDAMQIGFGVVSLTGCSYRLSLHEDGSTAVVEMKGQPARHDREGSLGDWLLILFHRHWQWLIGSEIALERVELAHALDMPYSAYSEAFTHECVFNSDAYRLVFPRTYLDRPIVKTVGEGERIVTEASQPHYRPAASILSWRARVKGVLRNELGQGLPPSTIEDLARRFAMSSQTLRRRLRADATSYRDLKHELRCERALDVLASGRGTICEASLASGFAEANALTRALKSKGISSSEFRSRTECWRPSLPLTARARAPGHR